MMTKNTIIAILLLLIGAFIGITYNQNIKINAYDRYNKDCEILLDSMAFWDNTFLDTAIETDTYYNYLESREYLDSLIWGK